MHICLYIHVEGMAHIHTYTIYINIYMHILTEGMARYSDAVDVNALAFSTSDTRPASIPPVHTHVRTYICMKVVYLIQLCTYVHMYICIHTYMYHLYLGKRCVPESYVPCHPHNALIKLPI